MIELQVIFIFCFHKFLDAYNDYLWLNINRNTVDSLIFCKLKEGSQSKTKKKLHARLAKGVLNQVAFLKLRPHSYSCCAHCPTLWRRKCSCPPSPWDWECHLSLRAPSRKFHFLPPCETTEGEKWCLPTANLTLLKLGIITVVKGGKIVLHIIYCLTLDTSEHEKSAINTYARMIGVNQHCLRQMWTYTVTLRGLSGGNTWLGRDSQAKSPLLITLQVIYFLWFSQQPTSDGFVSSCLRIPELVGRHPPTPAPSTAQVVLAVKNLPAYAGDMRHRFQSLGQEDPLEKEMATHSSILAWRIPWTEKPGGP